MKKSFLKKALAILFACCMLFGGAVSASAADEITFNPDDLNTWYSSSIPLWEEVNPDVRAWLRIPNTNINWPIVIGPDNLYYNSLGYDKKYSKNGVLWAGSGVRFGDAESVSSNPVIYGHNWTNYSANPAIARSSDIMFGQLTSFHHLSFAQATPYIQYSTPESDMIYVVFAAFYTDLNFRYIYENPDEEYLAYMISEARERSLHDYAVEVDSTDKLLTLSTCTRAYGKREDQRFVVMARQLRAGEDASVAPAITANTDFKAPQF